MKKYVNIFAFVMLTMFGLAGKAVALEATILIPKDPQITSKGGFFGVYHVPMTTTGHRTAQQKLFLSKKSDSVEVHRRVDNGTAGSGIIYTLKFSEEDQPTQTVLKFSSIAQEPKKYQEGLFGKFDVPVFSEEEALKTLLSGKIGYQVEIDTQYPVDSIKANFKRLANGDIAIGPTRVSFQYEVVPYRTGSKAIVKALLPAPPAGSDGVVDFKKMIDDFSAAMHKVAES